MVSYCGWVEPVFKALADPTRRELLDELFRHDGQTLGALAGRFAMTRPAVAKHLRLLEDAGLIANPSARPGEAALPQPGADPAPARPVGPPSTPRRGPPTSSISSMTWRQPWRRYSRSTFEPARSGSGRRSPIPEIRARYQFGAHIESGPGRPGRRYHVTHARGPGPLIEGENLEIDPPRRLVQSSPRGVGRRHRRRGHQPGHLGDRTGRRLMPAHRHPRPAAQRAPTSTFTPAGR